MGEVTIYRRYFYQSSCFQSGRSIAPIGVQVHSTGSNNPWLHRYVAPDDGRIGKNVYGNDHNRAGDVCAHAYIGKQSDGTVAVYQALPWTMRCWLSGNGPKGNANRLGYIGFEICEDSKTDCHYFVETMAAAAMLTAWLCLEYGIDTHTGVRDHHELHEMGLASDHADIGHWLKLHGETMDHFRAMVKAYMAEDVHVTYIDCDEVSATYQAKVISESYLNLRSGKSKSCASLARLSKGTVVDVINDSDPEWWDVSYAGITGCVMRMYLETLPEEKPEQPEKGTDQNGNTGKMADGHPDTPSAACGDASPHRGGCLTLENLTALKALLFPLLQEIEIAIQTLKGDESA